MEIIELIRGDDATIDFELSDDDGSAVDLTDATVYFTVKKDLYDAVAVIEKEVIDHTNPTEGETQISLTEEDMEIEPGRYVWDIQIVIDGVTSSINYGIFLIRPDVTRSVADAS